MNNGKLCVPVCAATADELIANIKRAEKFADVIEVRFDCLDPNEFDLRGHEWIPVWTKIANATRTDMISTLRPLEQGGYRSLSNDERLTFWNSGCQTDLCDIEDTDLIEQAAWTCGKRIVSHHDFSATAHDLNPHYLRLNTAQAEIIKVAVHVNEVTDAIEVWKLGERAKVGNKEFIPIAMGEAGKWTRILGLAHGAYLTYGSLERGKETADGQIAAKDLIDVYRVKELDKQTKVYGVIGDSVSSSFSPYIHNAAFVAAGINAVFIPLQVKNIDAFFRRMVLPATREVELNFAGFAVTMPHKQSVMKYLDEIDSVGEKIGAVNTIAIDDDKLSGYNTDAHGFITPLKTRLGELNGMRAAVLGAGGAARACVTSLKQEGADVTVFARDERKASSFASKFGCRVNLVSNLKFEISNFDVLVNATPLGMKGEFETISPLTADDLKGVKLVFDLVTRPNDTPLIREAKQAGVATVPGFEMLIEQAIKQFEIWTGRDAPKDVMRAAALSRMENTK